MELIRLRCIACKRFAAKPHDTESWSCSNCGTVQTAMQSHYDPIFNDDPMLNAAPRPPSATAEVSPACNHCSAQEGSRHNWPQCAWDAIDRHRTTIAKMNIAAEASRRSREADGVVAQAMAMTVLGDLEMAASELCGVLGLPHEFLREGFAWQDALAICAHLAKHIEIVSNPDGHRDVWVKGTSLSKQDGACQAVMIHSDWRQRRSGHES